ncbi:MAG: hypothetical protein IPK19_32210 [Chloroflexi bacterium]|nr:hypothetical protein [Chloroflexota bacterium]
MQLLLDNALKFSADRVTASIQAVHAQMVEFRVTDKGIGIAPEMLERIYEPFYQVDHASARRFGGTGVGLAIVRFIMDRHGLSIAVTSKPGHGSSFSFQLPAMPTGDLPR